MKFAQSSSDRELTDNITTSFEDGFEIITMDRPSHPGHSSNLYPISSNLPYSVTPQKFNFTTSNNNDASNRNMGKCSSPLDGISFKLSPALEMRISSSDPVLEEVKNTLTRVEKLLYSEDLKYDFRLEKDVLGEI